MIFDNLTSIFRYKNIRTVLLASYILIILVLFFSFIQSARSSALTWIKNDMQKKLDSYLLSADAEFNKKTGYAMSLVDNNSLRMPLNLGLTGQARDFLDGDKRIKNDGYKIIISDGRNKVIFNNTGLTGVTDAEMPDTSYSGYYYDNKGVFRINYLPIDYENPALNEARQRIGAIITAYNFLDFYNLVPESTEGISYSYYGIMDGRLKFILYEKPVETDRPVRPDSVYKLSEGFKYLNIDGKDTFMLIKHIKLLNNNLPYILAMTISPSSYNSIKYHYILRSIANCALVALIITFILGFAYYMLGKDFSNRLEIRNLRTQRHDFSKHLSVLRGMAVLGEYDELKQYMEILSEKVSFTGELSKIGCPPLGILIEDKEIFAKENDIEFKIDIDASLSNLRISPADLCTIAGNLLDNAIEACIECEASQKSIDMEIGNRDNYYYIKITNTGNKIQEKDLVKIFNPGYTTKKGKENSGMGLYIVSRTLRKYRGRIQVESNADRTTFTVYLPGNK